MSLYRFNKSPNSRKPLGDSRRSLGDILEDNLGDNLGEVSGNLRTSGDLSKRSIDTPKASFEVYKPHVESWYSIIWGSLEIRDSGVSRRGDISGEEIMAKHHGYLGV